MRNSPSINLAGQAFSENAQNSRTALCILIKFCMLYLLSELGITRNSVVYKIVILPLALKRSPKRRYLPLARTILEFVETVMMGHFFIVKTNLLSSHKTHPIWLFVQTN